MVRIKELKDSLSEQKVLDFPGIGTTRGRRGMNFVLVLSSARNKHIKNYKQTNYHICNFSQLDILVVSECMIVQQYVGSTLSAKIIYNGINKDGFITYADFDWAGDRITRRSTSGNVVMLTGGA